MRDELDALEFVLNAYARLPEGCMCNYTVTETVGLIQYVWDEQCPVHGLEEEASGTPRPDHA